MGWFKNMIKDWLKIQDPVGSSVLIQETTTFLGNCFRNQIWYRGDPSELHQYYTQTDDLMGNSRFWASTSTTGLNFRKIHTGLPALIVDTLADIVIDTLNNIKIVGNADKQEVWKKIEKENELKQLIKDAIIDVLIEGDGAFKISYDTCLSRYPVIEFYPGSKIDFIYKRGRTEGIIFKSEYDSNGKTYVLEELYDNNGIKNNLYEAGNHGNPVNLNCLNNTKDLRDVLDNDFMMAIPINFNKSKKYKGRGQGIFDKKLDNFDSFDEVWSQWIEAIRDNKTQTYFPENLIPRNKEGEVLKPNSFDRRFIKIENNSCETEADKIERKTGEFDFEGLLQSYITALDLCLQGIISPSTLGIDTKKLDNAEAQREKEKTTLYTRNKIVRVLEPVIQNLACISLMVYDKAQQQTPGEYTSTVDFGEYANPSFEAVVETIGKARPGQSTMSIERSVEELYGDSLSKEEKEEEVKRLKEEQGMIEKEEPSVAQDSVNVIDNDTDNINLNGAQISSMLKIIQSVKTGDITRNSAISIITSALGISKNNAEQFIEEQINNA